MKLDVDVLDVERSELDHVGVLWSLGIILITTENYKLRLNSLDVILLIKTFLLVETVEGRSPSTHHDHMARSFSSEIFS